MNQILNNVFFYILVVDDDRDDQFFLRKAITEVIPQAIIESLYDGSEALAYLEKCTALPNLIFLDLNMVKLSGKATISVIRKNESLNKVPVVIFTTSRNEREKEEILNLGADDFYSKPFHPGNMVDIVKQVKNKWL